MHHSRFPAVFVLLLPLISAQTLIPSTLPACAQQCTVLQQAQTACVPAGGAPVSNQAVYQSCFCQSAYLTQLQSPSPVSLCDTCSPADMATIQSWYKGTCQAGAAQNIPTTTTSTTSSPTTSPTTPPTTTTASGSSAVPNQQDSNAERNNSNKSWMATHWRWIVMVIVIAIGLALIALISALLHRRYHRRREAQWAQATVLQPDINTWGPGQSVHDFGVAGTSTQPERGFEKGKAREQVRGVRELPPARMREWTGEEGEKF